MVEKEEKTSNVCALRICIMFERHVDEQNLAPTLTRTAYFPRFVAAAACFFLPFAIGVFPSFSIYHRRVGDRENKSFHTPHAAPFLICWRCDAATATAAAMCEHGQCKYRKWGWSALRQCSTVYISETMGRETTHTKREHIHYFT